MRHALRRVDRARPERPPCPYHGGPSAIDAALARIDMTSAYLAVRRRKTFADNLLTGRPVHMEVCRSVALSEDIRAGLRLCDEIHTGLGPMRVRASGPELRGTVIALRWRRRFPEARRIFRERSPFFGGR